MCAAPGSFLCFDVEVPNRHNDRICALGVCWVKDGQITDSRKYLIDPECAFDVISTGKHGITARTVAGCPAFPEVWRDLAADFSGSVLAAHQASFDLSALRKTLEAYGEKLPPVQYVDTLAFTRSAFPGLPSYGLETVCNALDVPLVHHDPLSDCRAVAAILLSDKAACAPVVRTMDYYAPKKTGMEYSAATEAIKELREMMGALAASGAAPEAWAAASQWLYDHSDLAGNFPYDDFLNLFDGIMETVNAGEDLADIRQAISELLDPVSSFCTKTRPRIDGLSVVLTGEFFRGDKADVAAELEALGAVMKQNVSGKTGLVLVGNKGSAAWANGNYGGKVKEAIQLREKGKPVLIMREQDFFG